MKRIITNEDREIAKKLKKLWLSKANELGLTQEKMARQVSESGEVEGTWSQSTISQYLSCKIAPNTDAVLIFAKYLKVKPEEINPKLKSTIPGDYLYQKRLSVDIHPPLLREGDILLINPNTPPENKLVLVDHDKPIIGRCIKRIGKTLTLTPLNEPTNLTVIAVKPQTIVGIWYD